MIEKIYNGNYLTRLDNIIQWQERDVFQRESVSQHSYKVSIFCKVLLDECFKTENVEVLKFKNEVLSHALFHDWDEALILRDISHVTKYNEYNGDKIREVINDLANHLAYESFVENSNSRAGKKIYDAVMVPSKAVHAFVKLADWMALAMFVKREISMGNKNFDYENKYMKTHLFNAYKTLKEELERKFTNNVNTYVFENLIDELYGSKKN